MPVAPRLSSLFRSLEALRSEAVAQLEQRISRLRQVATANVLDAEPRLEPAVTGTLAIALRGEVERHAAWLEAELARGAERVGGGAGRADREGGTLAGGGGEHGSVPEFDGERAVGEARGELAAQRGGIGKWHGLGP